MKNYSSHRQWLVLDVLYGLKNPSAGTFYPSLLDRSHSNNVYSNHVSLDFAVWTQVSDLEADDLRQVQYTFLLHLWCPPTSFAAVRPLLGTWDPLLQSLVRWCHWPRL